MGEFAEDVLSISHHKLRSRPALTDPFRKRFGYFMVHEAIGNALTLDVLVQAIERAKSAKPKAVTEALHGARFEGGWTKAMPGGAVQFDQTGLNTLSVPIMVQWRKQGAGDGLAERYRQSFPGMALTVSIECISAGAIAASLCAPATLLVFAEEVFVRAVCCTA